MQQFLHLYFKENISKYNNFTEVSISSVAAFPATPQVLTTFRGNRSLMFVCTSGTNVEYSFDGITVHGITVHGISIHSWGS